MENQSKKTTTGALYQKSSGVQSSLLSFFAKRRTSGENDKNESNSNKRLAHGVVEEEKEERGQAPVTEAKGQNSSAAESDDEDDVVNLSRAVQKRKAQPSGTLAQMPTAAALPSVYSVSTGSSASISDSISSTSSPHLRLKVPKRRRCDSDNESDSDASQISSSSAQHLSTSLATSFTTAPIPAAVDQTTTLSLFTTEDSTSLPPASASSFSSLRSSVSSDSEIPFSSRPPHVSRTSVPASSSVVSSTSASLSVPRTSEGISVTASESLAEWSKWPAYRQSAMFREYINCFVTASSFSFPSWAHPKNIRDKDGRRPTNPDYDFSTMWVPSPNSKLAREEARPHYTPGMQQYWEIKQTRFDQLVLFKMGRFYEIFYIDACIAQKICDLKWMGGGEQKPHVGFPEQSLHHHAGKLVNEGYRVAVVEQMETPRELEERNKLASSVKDKAVRREVCEVFSKGTLLHEDMLAAHSKYLLALCFGGKAGVSSEGDCSFGLCYVDVATSEVVVGFIADAFDRMSLQTLLIKTSPAEVLYCPHNTPAAALKLLKGMPSNPQLTALTSLPTVLAASQEVSRYFPEHKETGTVLRRVCDAHEEPLLAFAAMCEYMQGNLIDTKVLQFASPQEYNPSQSSHLLLDGNALRNLEILQSQEGSDEHSLFSFLNYTCTAFGSRLFRRWICAPLYHANDINDRLDCVDWLSEHDDVRESSVEHLKTLCDVERVLARVCSRASEAERGAVYFGGGIVASRMKDFFTLMESTLQMEEILAAVRNSGELPRRLQILVSGWNNLDELCKTLQHRLEKTGDKEWQPRPGTDPEYDEVNTAVEKVEAKLGNALTDLMKEWEIPSGDFKFTHTKYRYEIECPDTFTKTLQQQRVDITSTRKGFVRFHTDDIKELVEELEEAEAAHKDAIYPFLQRLSFTILDKLADFHKLIRATAELDVLVALCQAKLKGADPMCRPEVRDPTDGQKPILLLENCRHPVAASLMDGFIKNDTRICTDDVQASVLLVTGPNMGGKSTVLRQTCIAVILAQLGSYVPARRCVLTCVDKLFTRIGARDSLLEGKSTFLIELEETATLLNQATVNSLCMIDELGRGTSTFDGTAIALAALEYIATELQCRCLFSTHFHLLCDEFRHFPSIENFHMASCVQDDRLVFLYKFAKGACPKSHGLHVARLAGIDDRVLECAAEKSRDLEAITTEFHSLARYRGICRMLANALSSQNVDDRRKAIVDVFYQHVQRTAAAS